MQDGTRLTMRYDIDTYHDHARPFFGVKLLTPREEFLADVTFLLHANLIATDVKFSNQIMDRNPKRITEFDTEYVLLETYSRGHTRGLSDGQHMTLVNPGVVHLIDWSRSYIGVTNNAEGFGVQIPHSVLDYDPSKHPAYLALPMESNRGRLLSLSLQLFVEALRRGPSRDAEMLGTAVIGLVRTCLLRERDWDRDPAQDKSRRALIEEHIRRNLGPGPLDIDRVCRDLGMSRATLYRTLGGGIERFVKSERLNKCFTELARGKREVGAVRRVAERWGFYDPGHFRRSFRASFGISPSDCLDGPRSQDGRHASNAVDHPVMQILRDRRTATETLR